MRNVRFPVIILCLVLPLGSTAAENAANPAQGPRLQVRCLTRCCRHQAPIPLELTFDDFGPRPVMAGVELVFSQGCVLSRYRTDKLVITGPRTRFLVTAPPLEISGLRPSGKNRPVRVDKFLLLNDKRVNFGYDLIAAGGESERSLVVGMVRIPGAGTTACAPLLQALRLERYMPGNAGQKAAEFPASTQVAGILPQYLPQYPLGWCAFDVVVLPENGFKTLTPSQLAALSTWIRAGGSVAVVAWMLVPIIVVVMLHTVFRTFNNYVMSCVAMASPGFMLAINETGEIVRAFRKTGVWLPIAANFTFYAFILWFFRRQCLRHADRFLGRM